MKVLLLSDSPLIPTGFSKVAHYIAQHLAEKHEVYYQGKNMVHIPLKFYNYQLLQGGHMDGTSEYMTRIYINKIKPDVIITLQDIQNVFYLEKVIKELNWKGKWIFYYPLDMEFSAPWHVSFAKVPDIMVTMSEFAFNTMKEWETKRLVNIPHGVNTKIFKPMEKDKEMVEDLKLNDYKHVIGFVGMNQFRKMIPKLLMAFKHVREKMDDVCLLLHTPEKPRGDTQSHMYPIAGIQEAFKIDNVIIDKTASMLMKTGVDEEYMARLFSVMDIHCSMSGGEGFSLCSLESLSSGIPNILTDWTTSRQLIGEPDKNGKCDRGMLVKVKDFDIGFNVEYRARADEKDAAKKLIWLLKNEKERKTMGLKASNFIRRKYEWNKIFYKWDKLLKEI